MQSTKKISNYGYKKSLHVFDSSTAKVVGNGFNVRYVHSLDQIVGYRIVSLLLDNLTGAFVNRPYFLLLCDLSRAQFAGHKNGEPSSIISYVSNIASAARVGWTDFSGPVVGLDVDTFINIGFEVRDSENNVLPSTARIIFVIEFTHCFE